MSKIRIGIVGAGRIGNVHAQSITYHIPEAEVVCVTDVYEPAAKKLAETYGIPKYGADYKMIVEDPDIDAVLVCSPTPTHADIAMDAMKHGKDVFCEKPVDLTVEKIQATAQVAKETGRKLQIGFNRRFDHNHGRVQQLAASGKLGNIELIKITSRDPEPPSPEYAASSGGLYIDMMIHDFDMAMFLAGCDVTEVYAMGTSLVDPRIGQAGDVDTAIVTLTFANGALGVIDNSRRAAYGYDQQPGHGRGRERRRHHRACFHRGRRGQRQAPVLLPGALYGLLHCGDEAVHPCHSDQWRGAGGYSRGPDERGAG